MRMAILGIIAFLFPMQAFADNGQSVRAGLMFLGTGFVSVMVEQQWGDTGARLTIGMFDTELCLSAAATQSFGAGPVRPFAGIGLFSVLIFPKGKPGGLLFASMPVGVDGRVSGPHRLGVEADLHYFLAGRDPVGNPVIEKNWLLPLPGINYRYEWEED